MIKQNIFNDFLKVFHIESLYSNTGANGGHPRGEPIRSEIL